MHDEFFKYNLENRQILIEILKMSLSENVFYKIDLDKIESQKTDFITDDLKEHRTDALFKAFIGGGEAFIYLLFEHKSYKDLRLGEQLFNYLSDIVKREFRRTGKAAPIIPIVIYNGEENWKPTGEFFSEYPNFKVMPVELKNFFLNFSYYFLDVSKVDKTKLGEITSLFFKVLSDGTKDKENIIENFHKHTKVFKDVWGEEKTSALIAYMTYIIKNSTKDDRKTVKKIFKEVLGEEKGEKEMETMLDVLNKEAEKRGMERGRNEGILLGRKEGIDEGILLGMSKGRDEGIILGRNEGILLGRKEEAIRTARQLIILGLSTEKIALATGLSLKEVEALR